MAKKTKKDIEPKEAAVMKKCKCLVCGATFRSSDKVPICTVCGSSKIQAIDWVDPDK